MADVPLTDTDQWTESPQGPGPSHPLTNPIWRSFFDQVNDRVRFLNNRLRAIFGTWQKFESSAIDATGDAINIPGHGWTTNTVVRYANVGGTAMGVGGSPIALAEGFAGAALYVIAVDADNIQLASSAGGAAIDISSAGSGTHYLYKVPSSLAAPVYGSFLAGGHTIPAGNILVQLATSFATLAGATFTGVVSFSGTGRLRRRAVVALDGTTNETFGPNDGDVFYCDTPAAQRDHEVDGGVNGDEVEVRRGAAGAHAIIIHRAGSPAAICTLPASKACSARLYKTGGVWTLLSPSADVIFGADAG